MLLRLARHVHLDEHREPLDEALLLDAFAELARQRLPIDGVDVVHHARHETRLVRLQVTDEVPPHIGEIGELRRLLDELLRVVLPEVSLPRGVGLTDRRSGLGLRYRDEAHRSRVALGSGRRTRDAIANGREPVGDAHRRRGRACQTIVSEPCSSGPPSKSPETLVVSKPL